MRARAVAEPVGEAEQRDHGQRQQEQRGGVVGQSPAEAHRVLARSPRACDDRESQDEQRIGEERAEDRRLRDDDLAGGEGEEDDEELGEVAERGLEDAGDGGAEAGTDRLGRDADQPGEPGEGDAGDEEHRRRRCVRVVERACDRGQRGSAGDERCDAGHERVSF